jgi:F-type H+-transporting ATPase subunit delta
MSAKLIAKKYAKALYAIAVEQQGSSQKFQVGLAAAAQLFAIPQAAKILKSPIMPDSLKRDLLVYVLDTVGANKSLNAFFELLISAQRVELLPEIVAEFSEILAASQGQQHGVLTSAARLSSEEITAIEHGLARVFAKQIVLENRVEPEMLGGFVVRVGNSVIDQSITSKIKALAEGLQHS